MTASLTHADRPEKILMGGIRIEGEPFDYESGQSWAGACLRRALIELTYQIHAKEELSNAQKLEAMHVVTNPTWQVDDCRPLNADGRVWRDGACQLKGAAANQVNTSMRVVIETAAHIYEDAALFCVTAKKEHGGFAVPSGVAE